MMITFAGTGYVELYNSALFAQHNVLVAFKDFDFFNSRAVKELHKFKQEAHVIVTYRITNKLSNLLENFLAVTFSIRTK